MKIKNLSTLLITLALLASIGTAYANEDVITYSDLVTNIDLILPPETEMPSLENHSYWQETDRSSTLYGIEATYQALYDDLPSLTSELPTIYTYIVPYNSEQALQTDFSNFLEDEKFQTGEWILLDTGVNSFSYKTGAGSESDLFMSYSSESNTLHHVSQQDNLLVVVNFYRAGGQYNRENVLAYEEYIEDYESTISLLESVTTYIREAIDFFLDDITPLGPPPEYDYYLTSAGYNLALSDFYNVPLNGSLTFDMYLDDTSEIGTILDTFGIDEASYGAISLGINENAILDYNLYDPFTASDCGDSAGWHHLYTEESIDLYEWTNIKIEFGESSGMNIYIDDELQGSCEVYKSRSETPLYLGDYPEDIIEESFVGYIKNFKAAYATDEEGQIIDYLGSDEIFADVRVGDPNAEAIAYLKEEEVIKGYDDGTFRPDQEINRAEILKMLLEGFGYNVEVDTEEEPFTDVDYGSWYAPYIMTAYEWRIVNGYDDGTFQPSEMVNRVEFLKILIKTYGIDLTDYPIISLYIDTELDSWYSPYVQYAKDYQLFDIDGEGNFYPDKNLTRGEAAEAIYRMLVQ